MSVRRKKVVKSPEMKRFFDFYIKICYNIYIRNDNFLEYIHNKGETLMIGTKYLSQLVNPSLLS